jgi:hypothetical protein
MAAEAHNKSTTALMLANRRYLNESRARAFGDNNHDISASGAALADFIQAEESGIGW